MATDKRQFTLRMQNETFEKIRLISDREKRSVAMQIEVVLEQFIKEYEKKNGDVN